MRDLRHGHKKKQVLGRSLIAAPSQSGAGDRRLTSSGLGGRAVGPSGAGSPPPAQRRALQAGVDAAQIDASLRWRTLLRLVTEPAFPCRDCSGIHAKAAPAIGKRPGPFRIIFLNSLPFGGMVRQLGPTPQPGARGRGGAACEGRPSFCLQHRPPFADQPGLLPQLHIQPVHIQPVHMHMTCAHVLHPWPDPFRHDIAVRPCRRMPARIPEEGCKPA